MTAGCVLCGKSSDLGPWEGPDQAAEMPPHYAVIVMVGTRPRCVCAECTRSAVAAFAKQVYRGRKKEQP